MKWLSLALVALLLVPAVALADGEERWMKVDEKGMNFGKMMQKHGIMNESEEHKVMPGFGVNVSEERVHKEKWREKIKERIEKMKELREKWRERLKELKEEEKESYKKYRECREKLREMRKRGIFNETYLEIAKMHVMSGIDVAIFHLQKLETRIVELNLSEDVTQELLEKIEEKIEKLNEWKAKVNESQNLKELREILKEFREEWREIKKETYLIAWEIAAERMMNAIEIAKEKAEVIGAKIEALKELGYNTTELEEAYNKYLEALDRAEEKVDQAKDLLEDALHATSKEEAVEKMQLGKRTLREAMEEIREAMKELRETFREYIKAIKEVSGEEVSG